MSTRDHAWGRTVLKVRQRDDWRCIRCGSPLELQTHHRQPRGAGGSKAPHIDCPCNLVTAHGSGSWGCHGWIEQHRTEAMGLGLLVSRYGPPSAEIPVEYHDGLWLLGCDGTRTPYEVAA